MNTLHLVCPHCNATNRVPSDKLRAELNCGQCHASLLNALPDNLNEAAFNAQLAKSELPMVVDFWAPWCGPCRMMAPAFEQAAGLLEPQVRVAKLNTEDEQGIAARFHIRSIPTLALFVNGQEVARQAGAFRTAADIAEWTRSHL